MAYSPDSSIAGAAITGFTAPTMTLIGDGASSGLTRRHVVSAYGGTVGTARANSVAYPFNVEFRKPTVVNRVPAANPLTGVRPSIPTNSWVMNIQKGGDAVSGSPVVARMRVYMDVPAGMESFTPDDLKAMLSFGAGLLVEEMADIFDSLATGTLP